jgi:hypothetical protein
MRRTLGLALLMLLVLLASAVPASAQACIDSALPLNFSIYTGTLLNGVGNVTVTCRGSNAWQLRLDAGLGVGATVTNTEHDRPRGGQAELRTVPGLCADHQFRYIVRHREWPCPAVHRLWPGGGGAIRRPGPLHRYNHRDRNRIRQHRRRYFHRQRNGCSHLPGLGHQHGIRNLHWRGSDLHVYPLVHLHQHYAVQRRPERRNGDRSNRD